MTNAEALARIKALCHTLDRGVGYRVSGDHSTWDAYTEGKSDFAGEVLELIDKLDREPPRPQDFSDDEREALALRLMQINPGCDAETAEFYRSQDSGGWRRSLSDAGDLMASPEWRNRHRGPITDEVRDVARKAAYGAWIATDLGADGPSLYAIVDAALEAAEAAR